MGAWMSSKKLKLFEIETLRYFHDYGNLLKSDFLRLHLGVVLLTVHGILKVN